MYKTLDKYRSNQFSQNGEDGVLHELLKRLDIDGGQFAEFGAWDGKHLSNTYTLLKNGWCGVYIEGDSQRFGELKSLKEKHIDQIEIINAFVEPEGDRSLDNLLSATNLRLDFDILSIDVDSTDWHIWHSLRNFHPKIVLIEISSSIPPGIEQIHSPPDYIMSSFSSMLKLGLDKGYKLVCHTGNMIFIDNKLVDRIKLSEVELNYPEILFDNAWCNQETQRTANISLLRKVMRKISQFNVTR